MDRQQSSMDAKEARFEALPALHRERTLEAKRTYCNVCKECGMNACSWESFPSYQEYMDCRINESELAGRAEEEIKDFSPTFGKHPVIESKEPSGKNDEKKERARAASSIYKMVCSESGLDQCFFSNFASWSDYVQGKIDESEFSDKARLELETMKGCVNQDGPATR